MKARSETTAKFLTTSRKLRRKLGKSAKRNGPTE